MCPGSVSKDVIRLTTSSLASQFEIQLARAHLKCAPPTQRNATHCQADCTPLNVDRTRLFGEGRPKDLVRGTTRAWEVRDTHAPSPPHTHTHTHTHTSFLTTYSHKMGICLLTSCFGIRSEQKSSAYVRTSEFPLTFTPSCIK